MIPAKVFLSGDPGVAGILQALAQALDALGVPVDSGVPPSQVGPAEPAVAPSVVVLVLSAAALASPDAAANLAAYEALAAENPATMVIPVLREPLLAKRLPAWLRQYQPIIATEDSPEAQEVIVRGVLRRLGVDPANVADDSSRADSSRADDSSRAAPLLAAESLDTSAADTIRLPVPPPAAAPTDDVATGDVATGDVATGDVATDDGSLDTMPLAVLPLPVAALDTVPLPAAPTALTSGQPPSGTLTGASSASWRQRLKQHRRPLALGTMAALILLLMACVVFSLGVGSPGGRGADRLESGVQGGSKGVVATAAASPTASAVPTASATTPKSTPAALHRTPTAVAPTSTAAAPTSTPVSPTPTPPIPGLHGDYFHSTKFRPGTPVPYPDPIFGAPWFSRTDTIIDMGYGNQSRTYTPPETAFDAQVCPSPPTSSPCAPFAVRWTGFVRPQYSEAYTFTTDSDDGVKLWINGQLVIDDWQIQGDTPAQSAPINLTANQLVPIQIEYYENGEGPATMVLQWQSASEPLGVIPPGRFYLPS